MRRDRGHECILRSPALDRVEIGDVQILEVESLDVQARQRDCVAADIDVECRGDREILGTSSSVRVNGASAKEVDDADQLHAFSLLATLREVPLHGQVRQHCTDSEECMHRQAREVIAPA